MSFEERMELTASGNKDWQYLQAALIMAERNKGTILDGFRGLIIEAGIFKNTEHVILTVLEGILSALNMICSAAEKN